MTIKTNCFTWRDAADIALQRSSTLWKAPGLGAPSYRAWTRNIVLPLYLEAILRRDRIVQMAAEEISKECETMLSHMSSISIDRLVDIGCGHGIMDIISYNNFKCDLHLVDIEASASRHHGYHSSGSGYGSLHKARAFLEDNGVPTKKIRTTNPKKQELLDNNVDAIVSILSAGFHYPVLEYAQFAKNSLRVGGMFIFDMRRNSGQEAFFKIFPTSTIINQSRKSDRILAISE